MAHPQSVRDELRKLYCFEKCSLEACAEQLGIPYSTARRWKTLAKDQGDDWDKIRTAHTLAGGEIEDIAQQLLTDLVIQFRATMDMLKLDVDLSAAERADVLTGLSDSFIKAVSANKKLLPQASQLAVAMDVLSLLADFIKINKPELLHAFLEVLEPFGEKLEKELK